MCVDERPHRLGESLGEAFLTSYPTVRVDPLVSWGGKK